ncbi:MAG: 2-oxoglutarate dehydrogenase E1 component [Rhodospirillaceae bacterium]|nr:2-oxoglutarate dehydrogenase E1 component [Rhodospirillaceae bacterium]
MATQAQQASFLYSHNAAFIADLYRRFLKDPNAVDPSWAGFFRSLGEAERVILDEGQGPSWAPGNGNGGPWAAAEFADALMAQPGGAPPPRMIPQTGELIDQPAVRAALLDSLQVLMLVRSHRVRGHLEAKLDPLGLTPIHPHPELDPATYGFGPGDWDRPIFMNQVLRMDTATLREIFTRVKETYCGSIGVEYMHMQDPGQKAWIQERIEAVHNRTEFTLRGQRAILERLTDAEVFERFLHTKYTGTKRFGLDGAESLVPALEQIIKRGGQLGLKEIVLGMAHRGRLNVLANVMTKPFSAIFAEFQGQPANPEDVQGSGDVKYHLGTSADRDFDGNVIHLSLTANPSHLEAVNPVVLGKVRAKQAQYGDIERAQILPVLLHGDAAFAGQGIVAEGLTLSELRGYRVGGTIHFIINNQIGFTTAPRFSRSGPYPTDVARVVQSPIFHVNGDDPEAVVHVSRVAMEFRHQFKKDVVVDMFCYRRYGHNEGDEPGFTQPLMYKTIARHPTTRQIYAQRLVDAGVLNRGEPEQLVERFNQRLEEQYEAASSYKPNQADWLGGAWSGMTIAKPGPRRGDTGVSEDLLREVGAGLTRIPKGFKAHSKIIRQLKAKQGLIEAGKGIDWATAEALAFGTLLCEGVPVRLSGQDSGRGTFSQRHSVLIDQETEERFVPLANLRKDQAPFEVHDSPLSEYAVLGFEYGFSLAEPKALVLWEAQFGDFANGAQVMIDQFICPGEAKWLRMSGLVMLLPHGFEGQGPEHSSARLERFLTMSGEDNWQVVNCTTPANYFHVLRRQIHREFRKPLVVMTPKSLLRHKDCVSDLSMFMRNSSFHRVLYEDEILAPAEEIRRVVICTGKVYYDLKRERDARELRTVTILRLEQLYPFPAEVLAEELKKYPNADVVWCQEEPANMGAWFFVDRRIERLLEETGHGASRPKYAGRAEAAAPATGLLRRHTEEQNRLVDEALTLS